VHWSQPLRVSLAVGVMTAMTACGDTPSKQVSQPTTVPTATARMEAADCPHALELVPQAVRKASAAVYRKLPRIFHSQSRRDASIDVAFTMRNGEFAEWLDKRWIRKQALRVCSEQDLDRSVATIVALPYNHLMVGSAVVLVARTEDGWRPWFLWFQYSGSDGGIIDP